MPGDKIMVLRKIWLDKILTGEKRIELRGQNLKPAVYFIGHKQRVYGVIRTGPARLVECLADFRELLPLHGLDTHKLPYTRTFAIPIEQVCALEKPVPYKHPRGAIGICRYVKLELAE